MSSANVNDRSTIAAVYPREAFEADAAQNARDKAAVLHGVAIASAVSESGAFALQRARRHVGENDPLSDTLFLAPFLPPDDAETAQTSAYGAAPEKPDAAEAGSPRGDAYESFIARIVDAATRAAFKDPIGRHEKRLRGFRGG